MMKSPEGRRLASPLSRTALLTLLLAVLPACVFHSHTTDLSGVDGIRGEPIDYQVTTSYAIHLGFTWPILGDAPKTQTVEAFAAEASERGGKRMRVANTSTSYWLAIAYFPLSLIFTPTITTVQGDVEGSSITQR